LRLISAVQEVALKTILEGIKTEERSWQARARSFRGCASNIEGRRL